MHCYNADGHTGAWLEQLMVARSLITPAVRMYPGHGEPGGLDLLDRQREYLLMYREAVERLLADDGVLSDAAKAQLVERMTRYQPGSGLSWLVSLSADAVAAELRGERAPAAAAS